MSRSTSTFFTLALAFALAAPLSAQQSALGASSPVSAEAVASSGPEQAGAVVNAGGPASSLRTTASAALFAPLLSTPGADARLNSASAASAAFEPQVRGRSSSVALMIVGGAGMIVGSIIGGDTGNIVMVGGGVVGLIGLWRYLQ